MPDHLPPLRNSTDLSCRTGSNPKSTCLDCQTSCDLTEPKLNRPRLPCPTFTGQYRPYPTSTALSNLNKPKLTLPNLSTPIVDCRVPPIATPPNHSCPHQNCRNIPNLNHPNSAPPELPCPTLSDRCIPHPTSPCLSCRASTYLTRFLQDMPARPFRALPCLFSPLLSTSAVRGDRSPPPS